MLQLDWYWNWFISTIKQDILQITCRLLDQSEAACTKQLPLKVNIIFLEAQTPLTCLGRTLRSWQSFSSRLSSECFFICTFDEDNKQSTSTAKYFLQFYVRIHWNSEFTFRIAKNGSVTLVSLQSVADDSSVGSVNTGHCPSKAVLMVIWVTMLVTGRWVRSCLGVATRASNEGSRWIHNHSWTVSICEIGTPTQTSKKRGHAVWRHRFLMPPVSYIMIFVTVSQLYVYLPYLGSRLA